MRQQLLPGEEMDEEACASEEASNRAAERRGLILSMVTLALSIPAIIGA